MNFIKLFALSMLLITLHLPHLLAQENWSTEDKMQYFKNRQDSTKWDMELLKDDLEDYLADDWPTKAAISQYPSPVLAYDWGYGVLFTPKFDVYGLTLHLKSIGFAKDQYRKHQLKDTSDYYINYFNIIMLTDLNSNEHSRSSIISRNYPYYLSTGKQKTSKGAIDWVHINSPDGGNYAIINRRYFDLAFGSTIFVLPLQDGSLRFLQVAFEVPSPSSEDLNNPKNWIKQFVSLLESNAQIEAFLSRGDILK